MGVGKLTDRLAIAVEMGRLDARVVVEGADVVVQVVDRDEEELSVAWRERRIAPKSRRGKRRLQDLQGCS